MIWKIANTPANSASKPAPSRKKNAGAMTTPSKGWTRKPLTQSMCSGEWCTEWKRHMNGTSWANRWVQYDTKSNRTKPTNGSTAAGSSPTSGRRARPGSQNRLRPPITMIRARPATLSSGPSRAKLMSVPTIGRRRRWPFWRGYIFSNGTTITNSAITPAKIPPSIW